MTDERHLFIDFFRTIVILLMLEGHVVRTVLLPALQQSVYFQIHEFVHGLSAPAFLFGAGLTFVISTRKKWNEYHRWGPELARRVRRFAMILCLGLFLHLPYFSLRKLVLNASAADILELFQADVLATIGIGLLLLHVVVMALKREELFYRLVLAAVVVIPLATPVAWNIDAPAVFPLPVAQLINGRNGSFFPLFPYIGFLFSGVLVSWNYLRAARLNRAPAFMFRLSILGASLIVAGLLLDFLPLTILRAEDFWVSSPEFFLIRLGALMILAPLVWFLTHRIGKLPPPATVLGRESLFVYVVHLLILYGSSLNPSLNVQAAIGAAYGLPEAAGLYLLVAAGMFLASAVWHEMKRRITPAVRLGQVVTAGALVWLYCVRDY